MTSASVAEILALRIRASLERGFVAQAEAEHSQASVRNVRRNAAAPVAPAAGVGWGTRPIRRRTACRCAVQRDSLGWGTRPL
jgi:hypothetical protein